MALNRRGFVLLAVLWVLVAVGALALLIETAGRGERRGVQNLEADLAARWAARGALADAVASLDSLTRESVGGFAITTSGDTLFSSREYRTESAAAVATVRDIRSRLNVNLATAEQLYALARAAGLDSLAAVGFADVLLDWRDPDGVPRPHGAEAGDYARLQPPGQPADGPITDLRQLAALQGMTSERFARLVPYLTEAGDGLINPNGAELPVLASLPGMDSAAAAMVIEYRREQPLDHQYALIALLPATAQQAVLARIDELNAQVAFSLRDIEIVAVGRADGGRVFARVRALLRLEGATGWEVLSVTEW